MWSTPTSDWTHFTVNPYWVWNPGLKVWNWFSSYLNLRIWPHCVYDNTRVQHRTCFAIIQWYQFQDTNFRGRVGKDFLIQRGCMPGSLVYQTARLVGCPQNVNPVIYYPEFHLCQCRSCERRTHHCVRKSRYPLNQFRKTCPKKKGKDSQVVTSSNHFSD